MSDDEENKNKKENKPKKMPSLRGVSLGGIPPDFCKNRVTHHCQKCHRASFTSYEAYTEHFATCKG
jgi:hypothetical protein